LSFRIASRPASVAVDRQVIFLISSVGLHDTVYAAVIVVDSAPFHCSKCILLQERRRDAHSYLSGATVCVILRLAISLEHRLVTDRQTHDYGTGELKMREWKMQEWKKQEVKYKLWKAGFLQSESYTLM